MLPSRRRERPYAAAGIALVLLTWSTLYWARMVSDWLRDRGWLMATMTAIFALAAGAVLVLVVRARPRGGELAILTAFAAGYAAAVVPLLRRPEEALHFVQYGLVGGLFYAALAERRRRLPGSVMALPAAPAVAAILLTAAAGWVDEGIQHLLPNRYYDLRDVAFNASAGALAVGGMAARSWARGRSRAAAALPPSPP
jgi:hypothetical protein